MISDNKEVLDFVDRLVRIDRLGAEKFFNAVREQGSMSRTVDQLILPALEIIGKGWEEGTVALAQVYMSSRICEELMANVPPAFSAEHSGRVPMAIAVLEDYHQLGKIIISACLRASGYSFQDYGRVTPGELAQKIIEDSIEIVLISTLMLRSALLVKEVKDLLERSGSSAHIVVGGAPFRFDPQLWQEVGADAMGANATEAVAAIAACMHRN
ncbi:MAG: cobalamin B12-binding domain-containing protein [Candidatus Electrothrix sp. AUS4]|nr:cobalamin B12-binding domain-containing protein [Candidatus Electrothrix sp. AUS4]